MEGKMVPIACVVSKVEALVIVSMLNAAGIIVRIGAEHHASVDPISIALGNYWLTVPDWQYQDASNILAATFAAEEHAFSEGLQTAVIRLLIIWLASLFVVAGVSVALSYEARWRDAFFVPLMMWPVPVNPQGRSDYFLP
jgi:hypothetical protein